MQFVRVYVMSRLYPQPDGNYDILRIEGETAEYFLTITDEKNILLLTTDGSIRTFPSEEGEHVLLALRTHENDPKRAVYFRSAEFFEPGTYAAFHPVRYALERIRSRAGTVLVEMPLVMYRRRIERSEIMDAIDRFRSHANHRGEINIGVPTLVQTVTSDFFTALA